jgi:hypothetical protein
VHEGHVFYVFYVLTKVRYVPTSLTEGLQSSYGVMGGETSLLVGVLLEVLFNFVGVVLPSFPCLTKKVTVTFLASESEGLPCDCLLRLFPGSFCHEEVSVN